LLTHFIREIYSLERDSMSGDLFAKLVKFAGV